MIQPLRRIAYHLRGKLEKKLDELVQQDIIEKVDKASPWVSPVVVLHKRNDIRYVWTLKKQTKLSCVSDTLYLLLKKLCKILIKVLFSN